MVNQILFSPSQDEAINSVGKNLLVAAGAGSGKTTVLVARILRHIEEGGRIDQILALTFTNAAAADMKEKLDKGIADLAQKNPRNNHLREQQSMLPQAQISTIHSFCLDLLRQNYYQAGLDAGFKVASQVQIALLEQETINNYLEEAYADPNSGVCVLADAYGGNKDDSGLIEIMLNLYKFCRSRTEPLGWLGEVCEAFKQTKLECYPFAHEIRTRLQNSLVPVIFSLKKAMSESEMVSTKWQEAIAKELAQIQLIQKNEIDDLNSFLERFGQITFGRLNAVKDADIDIKNRVKSERDKAKLTIKKMQKKYTSQDSTTQALELHSFAPLMTSLYQLIAGFEKSFSAEKRHRGWIDFSDMEHFTLGLLKDDDFAGHLASSYQEILIDEYQDINEVQESILRRLAQANNLFAVGDVKQSIYRFRLAEPQLFLQMYDAYGKSNGGQRIDLNNNYRSEIEIINGVNYVFDQLMRDDVAEIDYDDAAKLYSQKTLASTAPEFCLIDMDNGSCVNELQATSVEQKSNINREKSTPIEAEARFISSRIVELHDMGYKYGDMAVLLRAPKGRENHLTAELAKWGVPALFEGDQSYLESSEIDLIINALSIIDNPSQDIPLAAVLRSPIADFTPDQLIEIRYGYKDGNFYQALVQTAEEQLTSLSQKCASFLKQLTNWRELAGERKVSELISYLYRENGYYNLVGAMQDGAIRQANLHQLLQEAYDYENQEYAGLFRFLKLLASKKEQKLKSVVASLPDAKEDAVQIMSIHKSKGLEFPIVFIMGIGGQFNFLDERRDIVWDRDAGLGPMHVDRKLRLKHPSIAHTAVADRLHELSLAEEIRIYYVALTRAKERLILSAAAHDIVSKITAWADVDISTRLPAQYLLQANTPLSWFGAALLRHPNATGWRDIAGIDQINILAADGVWQLNIQNEADLPSARQEENTIFTPEITGTDIPKNIETALSFTYPYSDVTTYPAKWTVSALNRLGIDEEEVLAASVLDNRIAKDEQPTSDPTTRGNAYHAFLEKVDLSKVGETKDLQDQLIMMVNSGKINLADQEIIDCAITAKFFDSALGERFQTSKKVIRELKFTFLDEIAKNERIVVQGILDAAFWEEDGWVLIDYKTGGRSKNNEQLQKQYSEQLAYYAKAVERILNAPVKETWLVMLDLNKNIAI